MKLDLANDLIATALDYGRTHDLKPLTIAVIDAGGNLADR
jgi:uncharacterized protein GlcG (DUF336 family)